MEQHEEVKPSLTIREIVQAALAAQGRPIFARLKRLDDSLEVDARYVISLNRQEIGFLVSYIETLQSKVSSDVS